MVAKTVKARARKAAQQWIDRAAKAAVRQVANESRVAARARERAREREALRLQRAHGKKAATRAVATAVARAKRLRSEGAWPGSVTSRIKRVRHDMPRPGSKAHRMLSMLAREGGTTIAQLETATEWAPSSLRTAIQRLCPAYGFTWRLVAGADGEKSRYEATR